MCGIGREADRPAQARGGARPGVAGLPPPPSGVREPPCGPMRGRARSGHDDRMTTESLDAGSPANAMVARAPAAVVARAPRIAIAMIAVGAVALELAVSGRYGYVRDELYFLAAGQHLAFGYVDQPALTPLLARASAVLGGNSLVGLRVLPALTLAAIVVLTAAMSRSLGAGRTGQLLAALAAATCGQYIAA